MRRLVSAFILSLFLAVGATNIAGAIPVTNYTVNLGRAAVATHWASDYAVKTHNGARYSYRVRVALLTSSYGFVRTSCTSGAAASVSDSNSVNRYIARHYEYRPRSDGRWDYSMVEIGVYGGSTFYSGVTSVAC